MRKKINIDFFLLLTFVITVLLITQFTYSYCNPYLKDLFDSGYQIYLVESSFSLKNINEVICHGQVIEMSKGSYLLVSVNEKIYFLISQISLFLLALILIFIFKLDRARFLLYTSIIGLGIQVIFNYNFGLNMFNQIFLNNLLFLFALRLFIDES